MTALQVEGPGPEKPKPFREIFLANWVPALLTAIVGGLVAAGFVPFATNYFETSRLLQDRRTRVVEATSDAFAGVVANTGKIRALETQVAQTVEERSSVADGSAAAKALDDRIERWRKELRESEVALYGIDQKLYASLTLATLLFERPETIKSIDDYFEWYRSQTQPITPDEVRDRGGRVLDALVKEMKR